MTTAYPMPDPEQKTTSGLREFDLVTAYHVLIERFWLIASCMAVFVLIGLVYIALATREYQAVATIQVDQNDLPLIAMQQSPQGNTLRDLDVLKTIEMELGRRSLLVRVLKRPEFRDNIYLRTLAADPENPDHFLQLEKLRKKIQPKLRRGTRLIDVAVEFRDPLTAQQLANGITGEYLLEMITTRSGNSADVTQFLGKEAEKMKAKLDQTEQSLQDYKAVVDIRTRILETEKDIATLNKRYLPKHPKLISAQNLLKDLKIQFISEMRRRSISGTLDIEGDPNTFLADPEKLDREMARQESRYNVLQRDLQADRAVYEAILQRRTEGDVTKSSKLVSMHVTEPAMLPVKPVKPRKLLVLAFGALGGGLIGVVLAFWLNSLDSSLKTVDEAEHFLAMPLLGAIPECRDPGKQKLVFEAPFGSERRIEEAIRHSIPVAQEAYHRATELTEETMRKLKERGQSPVNGEVPPEPETARPSLPTRAPAKKTPEELRQLVMIEEPASIVAEAFRNMRAGLKLLGAKEERKTFLFTSAVPSEGKSFISANFAISLAQEGARVLLIDADLRRPTAHKTFNLRAVSPGVTEYITGQGSLAEVVTPTHVKNLDVMLAGSMSPNPAELLSAGGFVRLLEDAGRQYDRIVIDSAPIHAVSDTLLICNATHTVCLVVRAGGTPRAAVNRAARMLRHYGARLSGFVMNRLPMRTGFGSNPYYYYYQSSEKYGEAYGNAYGSSRKS